MEEFLTRSLANEGIKIPLFTKDNKPTDKWVKVFGADSDASHKARARLMTGTAHQVKREAEQIEDLEKRRDFINEKQRDFEIQTIAALIIDWNLEKNGEPFPCTDENKLWFLREAPQIADQIDKITADRRLFFEIGQTSFSDLQKQS